MWFPTPTASLDPLTPQSPCMNPLSLKETLKWKSHFCKVLKKLQFLSLPVLSPSNRGSQAYLWITHANEGWCKQLPVKSSYGSIEKVLCKTFGLQDKQMTVFKLPVMEYFGLKKQPSVLFIYLNFKYWSIGSLKICAGFSLLMLCNSLEHKLKDKFLFSINTKPYLVTEKAIFQSFSLKTKTVS